MAVLFTLCIFLLLAVTFVMILLGMITPNITKRVIPKASTRIGVMKYFGSIFIVSFFLLGFSASAIETPKREDADNIVEVVSVADDSIDEIAENYKEDGIDVDGENGDDVDIDHILDIAEIIFEETITLLESVDDNVALSLIKVDESTTVDSELKLEQQVEPVLVVESEPELVVELEPEPEPVIESEPVVELESESSCYCASNSHNCSNFSSHASAQAFYECCLDAVGYDVHRLDGNDNDGLACEGLN